ncbi:MAG TPA: amidophosphoribosyltransferase [Candidatus Nanoarchaeia archaeon]|nr:amidophosphoribosyltransferase [Candidatus Nanoarchaeia archaeon]
MSGEVKDECGIAAVSLKKEKENNALFYIYRLLLNLQNRGQLSAGVTTYNKEKAQLLSTYRNIGTVNEVFKTSDIQKSMQIFKNYSGIKGIGHVRYATFGANDRSYAQPFERKHGRLWKWFSFCFNGNLVNFAELKRPLVEKTEYHFILNNDTEIIQHYLARELKGNKKPDVSSVFHNLSKKFDGAYNIAYMDAYGDVVVSRDPLGFRPLVYSIKDGNLFAASESNALLNIGVYDFKSLKPGELIHVSNGNISVKRYAKSKRRAHCMFEWVYFANVGSVLDSRSVYVTRTRLGKELAKLETENITDEYIVVPVPDTAKAAGDAYAYELGVPSMEGLIRNRFVGRTFIEGSKREDKVASKYTVIKEILRGKKVLLVDDSIVRGTTTNQIVKFLKTVGGAKEVHIRATCPPIIAPCFYGIDMSTVGELLVPRYTQQEGQIPQQVFDKIASDLEADSLIYQTIPGLIKSIGLSGGDLCLGCLTGKYPTECGKATYCRAIKEFKIGRENQRSYEH